MDDFNSQDELIEWLTEKGAIVLEGVDQNGEILYRYDLDILKEVAPPLYDIVMEEIDHDIMQLYKAGFVDIEYDEDLTARFKLSEKGVNMAQELRNNFPFLN